MLPIGKSHDVACTIDEAQSAIVAHVIIDETEDNWSLLAPTHRSPSISIKFLPNKMPSSTQNLCHNALTNVCRAAGGSVQKTRINKYCEKLSSSYRDMQPAHNHSCLAGRQIA